MKISHAFPILGAAALMFSACEPKPTLKEESPAGTPTPTPELAERVTGAAEQATVTLKEAAEKSGAVASEAADKAGEIAKEAGAAVQEAGKDAMQSMRDLADDVTRKDTDSEVPSATPMVTENVVPTPEPTPEVIATPEPTPTIDPIGS